MVSHQVSGVQVASAASPFDGEGHPSTPAWQVDDDDNNAMAHLDVPSRVATRGIVLANRSHNRHVLRVPAKHPRLGSTSSGVCEERAEERGAARTVRDRGSRGRRVEFRAVAAAGGAVCQVSVSE